MAARKPGDDRPAPPIVRYAPLGELKVFELSEAELEKLESGPPGQVHLSFALALLPAALTVFITIQTVEISSDRIYYGYWIAFWLLFVQGLISLVRWWTTSGSLRTLVTDIRSRMPEHPGIPEQATRSLPLGPLKPLSPHEAPADDSRG
jgi:hypothetical protein